MKQVTKGTTTVNYSYDPFGRRIQKNVNGTITQVVYDNEDIVIECATNGTLKARYTHGPGMDEPLGLQKGTTNYYYHADGLGSIVALTNTKGASAQLYRYDSFGRITQSGSVVQPYTYTAREYDTETGLYYYRARYYDPKAGRFITRDPILHPSTGNSKGCRGSSLAYQNGAPSFEDLQRNPQNLNTYAYAINNPINFDDPLGLACGSGWKQIFVPDNWFGWYSFEGPCSTHDDCYGCEGKKMGKSQETCDAEFYSDMKSTCNSLPRGAYWRNHCNGTASIYYDYVRKNGKPYFDKARKECCDK